LLRLVRWKYHCVTSASLRANSKVSPIWQYGTEIRELDRPGLDKHWLCNLCLPVQRVFKTSDGPNGNTTAEDERPFSVPRTVPIRVSHSCTVLSSDPEATSWPSGEKTTVQTEDE